jgi:hypothetical protein
MDALSRGCYFGGVLVRGSTRRRSGARIRAASVWALAAVVLASASSAIPRYLYCPASQAVHLSCCCPDVEQGTDVVRASCCEVRESTSADSTNARSFDARIAPALPAVSVAVIDLASLVAREPAPHARLLRARAGPAEPLYRANSVFLL